MKEWGRTRLKHLASVRAGTWGDEPGEAARDVYCVRAADFDRQRLRVSAERLPVRSVDPATFRDVSLKPGDIVLEKSGGGPDQPVGGSVLFELDVDAVPSNFAARLRPITGVDPRFLNYLMAAMYFAGVTRSLAKQTTGIANLDVGAYMAVTCAVPRLDVQEGVADYLDAQTAQIDTLIETLQNSVRLLRERRAALITRAVTPEGPAEGPQATPRASGFAGAWPLLGVIAPTAGWETRRIGDLVELTNGYPFDSGLFGPDGTLPLVRIRDLFLDEFVTYVSGLIPDQVVLRDGDLVIGMDGDFELSVWRRGPAALNQRMCLLRPRPGVDARFIAYALPRHLRVLNDLTYATTVKHLSSFDILSERILCPPSDEQRAIADYLDMETARIDGLVSSRERQVDLLRERRRTLITAAVTGQLAIPGVAA